MSAIRVSCCRFQDTGDVTFSRGRCRGGRSLGWREFLPPAFNLGHICGFSCSGHKRRTSTCRQGEAGEKSPQLMEKQK